MTEHRHDLPPMPARIAALPVDERGYPIPYFAHRDEDGKPDHRVMEARKMAPALRASLCWICGQPLGAFKAFTIGPMCAITRTISEPPSHRECAEWSAKACPFLSRPKAKRREAGLPDVRNNEGYIARNPGATCVWITKSFEPFRSPGGDLLFEIGNPVETSWFAEGRAATREEVEASIDSGIGLLELDCLKEDSSCRAEAQAELHKRRDGLTKLLDKSFGAMPC